MQASCCPSCTCHMYNRTVFFCVCTCTLQQGADVECLKALIAFGASINPLNTFGQTPLDVAAMSPTGTCTCIYLLPGHVFFIDSYTCMYMYMYLPCFVRHVYVHFVYHVTCSCLALYTWIRTQPAELPWYIAQLVEYLPRTQFKSRP